jgi:peptidoglycan/xylan/chitin deacetylase (PgdA/CDA1 family)
MLRKNKINHKIVGFVTKFLKKIKAYNFFASKNSLRVLIYHNINSEYYEHLLSNFSQLIKDGWKFIDPVNFEHFMDGNIKLVGKNLLITFDDGYKSDGVFARILEQRLGIKSLLFLTYDFVCCEGEFETSQFVKNNLRIFEANDFNSQSLNTVEIDDLIKHGNQIGAHTSSHINLNSNLSEEVIKVELYQTGDNFAKLFNTTVNNFAYPFGGVNDFSQKLYRLAILRYKFIHTGIRGDNIKNRSNKIVFRDAMNPAFTIEIIEGILSGYLDFLYYFKRKRALLWEL